MFYFKNQGIRNFPLGTVFELAAPVYTETCTNSHGYTFEFSIWQYPTGATDWISYDAATNLIRFESRQTEIDAYLGSTI